MVLSGLLQAVGSDQKEEESKDTKKQSKESGASFVPKEFQHHEVKNSKVEEPRPASGSGSQPKPQSSSPSNRDSDSNDKLNAKAGSSPGKSLSDEAKLSPKGSGSEDKAKDKKGKKKKDNDSSATSPAPFSIAAASSKTASIKTEKEKKKDSTSSSKTSGKEESSSPDVPIMDLSQIHDDEEDEDEEESSEEEDEEELEAETEVVLDATKADVKKGDASSAKDGEKEDLKAGKRKKKKKAKPKPPPPKRHVRMFHDGEKLKLGLGKSKPHGISLAGDGRLNFALLSPHSETAYFILIVPPGHAADHMFVLGEGESITTSPKGEFYCKLDPEKNKSGGSWHVELTLSGTKVDQLIGIRYTWLIDPEPNGPWDEPAPSEKRLIDPYTRVLDSACAKNFNLRTEKKYSPLPVIPDFKKLSSFDWQGIKAPGYELKELIIYETHVRGFTMNQDARVRHPGTFLGFIEKIPHLLNLGINCVELLPIFEFDETSCPLKNPHTQEQLCNYWGYNTCAFFVPMQRFASKDAFGSSINEFKILSVSFIAMGSR
jgi:hypothetical protein